MTQRYFKKHIMARFMTPEELEEFHIAYKLASTRPVPDNIKTYQVQVIERMLPEWKMKRWHKKYQEAKVPTTQNLHYGKKMEDIIRRVTLQVLKEEKLI